MGTYLEDSLESMYMLPSEIKRNFDLMRELDKTSYPLIDELHQFHKEYLTSARHKVLERCNNTTQNEPDEAELRALVDTDAALDKLREKHQRVVQKLDEKIAIAAQSYDIVDHHIRRLDQDLEAYAALLKQNDEYEDDKTTSKKRKLAQAALGGEGAGSLKLDSAFSKQAGDQPEEKKQKTAAGFVGSGALPSALTLERSASSSGQQSSRKSGAGGSGTGRKRAAAEPVEVVLVPAQVPIGAEDLPIDPNEPVYCNCRRVSFGQMVGCDNDDCKYEWFHFECVGLTDQPQGKWYCPDCKVMLGIK